MRTLLYILLLALIPGANCLAQKEANIWYFGDGTGLDFNNDTVIALTDGQITSDVAGSTICNNNGNLLFYTDGKTVWNAIHDTMPNGTGLMGDATYVSAIIAPQPGNDSLYYIFTLDGPFFSPVDTISLRYTIVNMNLDGGKGDVISGFKNIPLLSRATEKLTAIRHANGCGIWILAHQWDSDAFYAYLLTDGGISPPVITNVGTPHTGSLINAFGEMKATLNGEKVALILRSDRKVEILAFDNSTGVLSSPLSFLVPSPLPFSFAISSDNTKLYVPGVWQTDSILQYDISVLDSSVIQSSQVNIGPRKDIGIIQIAPDYKVYMSRMNKDSIGVINNPDSLGSSSDYQENGLYLAGKVCKQGLPNFISTYLNPTKPEISLNYDTVCLGSPTSFYGVHPYNVLSWLWNFGDTASPNNTDTAQNPVHVFSDTGVYNVRLIITGVCRVDTVIKTIVAKPNTMSVDIGNDTTACYGASVTLNADNPGSAYAWSTGDTTQTIAADSAGAYYVTVSQQGCSVSDTINISRYPEIAVSLGGDTVNCGRDTIVLDAGSAGSAYLWSDGSAGQTLNVAATGTYWVEVSKNGCTVTDTVKIIQSALSAAILNGDTAFFSGGSIQLSGTVTGSTDYAWSPAAGLSCTNCLNPLASPEETTAYMLTATDANGCVNADIVVIGIDAQNVLFIPDIFSPNNDGSNDVLYVMGKNIKSLKFSVYDRWGEKVFETNDLSVGWDGTYRGQPVNPGVFVYSVTGRFTNGEIINEKGDVTLVR